MKLTIYHDGQYWVGVVEEQDQGKLKAARYIFGTEPKDEEILHFIREEMCELVSRLSQEVAVKGSETKKINPKRLARQAAYELRRKGVSSNAQEALKLEYEKRKLEKRTYSKQQKESMKARIRELKERKRKKNIVDINKTSILIRNCNALFYINICENMCYAQRAPDWVPFKLSYRDCYPLKESIQLT
ncbi:hypothetical protein J2W97_003745 [Paenibacillus jamilae]|nr:hypothetical protein [Paenibacillus jamilae]